VEGRVRFFLQDRGYGFVELTDECDQVVLELFFHARHVIGLVTKNDLVRFWIDDDPAHNEAWMAIDVQQVGEQVDELQSQDASGANSMSRINVDVEKHLFDETQREVQARYVRRPHSHARPVRH